MANCFSSVFHLFDDQIGQQHSLRAAVKSAAVRRPLLTWHRTYVQRHALPMQISRHFRNFATCEEGSRCLVARAVQCYAEPAPTRAVVVATAAIRPYPHCTA